MPPRSPLIALAGLLLAASGCAQDQASGARPSHFASRTNRLGSNIPQPYDASADRGDNVVGQSNVEQMSQQGNTVGNMQRASIR